MEALWEAYELLQKNGRGKSCFSKGPELDARCVKLVSELDELYGMMISVREGIGKSF
jgi:hypothetical protein